MILPAQLRQSDPFSRLRREHNLAADQIWDALGPLTGRNQVAAAFYDSQDWSRFRKWERLFLFCQGGARRARRQILRHLDELGPTAEVLEVGIGDGENIRFLAGSPRVFGVDLARVVLQACAGHAAMAGRLAHAEAEALPFDDACFDACYSLGGFTYFRDHAQALAEMARVTRPGGILVVADELPQIHRYGIGRLIPSTRLIRFWSQFMGVAPDFIDMVLSYQDDPEAAIMSMWPGATRHAIWSGLGYCYTAIRPQSCPELTGGLPDVGRSDPA